MKQAAFVCDVAVKLPVCFKTVLRKKRQILFGLSESLPYLLTSNSRTDLAAGWAASPISTDPPAVSSRSSRNKFCLFTGVLIRWVCYRVQQERHAWVQCVRAQLLRAFTEGNFAI